MTNHLVTRMRNINVSVIAQGDIALLDMKTVTSYLYICKSVNL